MPISEIFTNESAHEWRYEYSTDVTLPAKFHHQLPNFSTTPLVPLHEIASELGLKGVYVKDETSRAGLPAFKILGASWGTFRAIAALTNLSLDASLDELASAAQTQGITLFAATEGNHGRAVARMGQLLSVPTHIFVPYHTDEETQSKISSEGAHVVVVEGDYDAAVLAAAKAATSTPNGLQIQDNAFPNYTTIPSYIVEGYATMLLEASTQLASLNLRPTVFVTPIGVGSLGHAVVAHCKSRGQGIRVLAVEPDTAACLYTSLREGRPTTVQTSDTIMDGMNCGTVSPISWPTLRDGVDASVTILDSEAHDAVQYLQQRGVNAGPCGAAGLAALRKVARLEPGALSLNKDSVVVLLSTEGKRGYPIPP